MGQIQETTIPTWYARKPYIHFDLPLSPKEAEAYVTNPQRVARHAFYPLLAYDIITPRIRKPSPRSVKPYVKTPKHRRIAYPAHKDGYIFSFYKSLLEAPYEAWLDKNGLGEAITAFRAIGENNVTLAKKAFDFIRANPDCKIIVTDVESFFDNLDPEVLKGIWARFLGERMLPYDHYSVFKAITKYSIIERHKAFNLFGIRLSGRLNGTDSTKRLFTPRQFRERVLSRGLVEPRQGVGIPQGTSLSPLLSNMYMADLDLKMHTRISALGGRYWRYCDDILMVIPGKCEPNLLADLDHELEALRLRRSSDKTHALDGAGLKGHAQLQYLGFVFNGTEAVIRSSSIHRYHRKLKKAVRGAKARQSRESQRSGQTAPLRKQALQNMYSDKPLRGKSILRRKKGRKYSENFTHYMERAAKVMDSPRISRQRRNVLKRFWKRLQ